MRVLLRYLFLVVLLHSKQYDLFLLIRENPIEKAIFGDYLGNLCNMISPPGS